MENENKTAETKAPKAKAPPVAPPPAPGSQEAVSETWYFAHEKKAHGPFSFEDMERKVRGRMILPNTPVWQQGMEGWVELGKLPEFQATLLPPADVPASATELPDQVDTIVVDKNGRPIVETAFKISKRGAIIRSRHATDSDPVWLVKLPSNPELKIRARSSEEAEGAYRRYMGIRSSEFPFQVTS
jgi:hypothetical protein